MNLRDHNDWNRTNGLLSVNLEPQTNNADSQLHVLLNGNTGNFCLDYTNADFDKELAIQRAWSTDTGYYVKIQPNDTVTVVRWWDRYEETLTSDKVSQNPVKFYQAITKQDNRSGSIVSFAKEAFLKLRNCILQPDNGQASLRMFMYLLASLEDNLDLPDQVDRNSWHLKEFNSEWISAFDWEWLHNAFKNGVVSNGLAIRPLVRLVLRHASNRLFQEAHREATKKVYQTFLFGGSSRKYDSGISDGAYYTPTPLVRTIVQEALWSLNKTIPLSERPSLRILDPACGSAEFLREALRQLKMLGYTGSISIIGWDISEIACEMAEFVLHFESRSEWNNSIDISIQTINSLVTDWGEQGLFDVILMNPPFTAFEKLGEYKTTVQAKLSGLIRHQPDGAAIFWKNASESLKEKGVLGVVLPHSFLTADTYTKLREYLKKDIGMNFSLIGRLGSAGLFEKAMIIPAVLVGIRSSRTVANTILWTDYQQTSAYQALRELRKYRLNDIPVPIVKSSFSIYENPSKTENSINEGWGATSYSIMLLEESVNALTRVGDLFHVKRGIDTGNNAAFLILKEEWLGLPKKERPYFKPCIMNESIQGGRLTDAVYTFYPYGEFEIENEDILKEKLPYYYKNKLSKFIDKLKKRRGHEEKWWELSRPRTQLSEVRSKLVSAYFGRAGYFALDLRGEFLVGQSFAWLPKKPDFDNERYLHAYLGLLHASILDKLLELVCNVLHGGYYDLSKHYVEKMPLPDLSLVHPDIFAYLYTTGVSIMEGGEIDTIKLNEVSANAYGLEPELFK